MAQKTTIYLPDEMRAAVQGEPLAERAGQLLAGVGER
jgi:hypothetical protein